MKSKSLLLLMVIILFFSTLNTPQGHARTFTTEQLVAKAEAYVRQLSPLINYERTRNVNAVSSSLILSTKKSIETAASSVSKMKSNIPKTTLQARMKTAEVTYYNAVNYNNSIGVGERLKIKSAALQSELKKNPFSDATQSFYKSLQDELGKFARSLGKVYGKSTRDAISKKYKVPSEIILNSAKIEMTKVSSLFSKDKLVINTNLRDTVMHPEKPILYSLSDSKDLIEINLETKLARSISFNLPAERIFFANNEIYVTLLKGIHSPYWQEKNQEGAFAVINPDTMKLIEQIDMKLDPFDIAADTENIYVTSGSGQSSYMKAFSRKTLLETANVIGVSHASYLEMASEGNKVYSIASQSSARVINAYQFQEGKGAGNYNSSYDGDYELYENMHISPDGKYLFNGSGVVLNSSASRYSDLTYKTNIHAKYEEIAFNHEGGRFYTSLKNGIQVFDYSTFGKLQQVILSHDIDFMFVRGSDLVVVYKDSALGAAFQKQIVKKYSLDEKGLLTLSESTKPFENETLIQVPAGVPQHPAVPVSMGAEIVSTDLVKEMVHPVKPLIYGITAGNTLLEYNMETKATRKITFDLPVEEYCFANNELYLTLKNEQSSSDEEPATGAFAVVDSETFTLIKTVEIPMTPYDIAADSRFIYISGGGRSSWTELKAYSRSTYEETGKFTSVRHSSSIEIQEGGNRLYLVDKGTYPRDIHVYEFLNGEKIRTYDSPYQGTYKFTHYFKLSPDGQYILNGGGVILKSSAIKEEDMKAITKLYSGFENIAFDVERDRFYISTKSSLDVYEYTTFKRIKHYELPHSIDFMIVREGSLIVTNKVTTPGTLEENKVVQKYPLLADGTLSTQTK